MLASVTPSAGLGIFLAEPAVAGQSLLTIPVSTMIRPAESDADEAGLAGLGLGLGLRDHPER